ncbi:unnamed protein product, partial [Rotaria magnacalcarata]
MKEVHLDKRTLSKCRARASSRAAP